MKIITIAALATTVCATAFAQFGDPPRQNHEDLRKKMELLERTLLIDAMEMDEETTLRFFSRRKEYMDEMKSLHDQIHENDRELKTKLEAGEAPSDAYFEEYVESTLALETAVVTTRREFVQSLDDLLTLEQTAKYMMFERKFRQELREAVMRKRRGGRDGRR
jgi:uncharacterized protein YpiB (UPF0302 family)